MAVNHQVELGIGDTDREHGPTLDTEPPASPQAMVKDQVTLGTRAPGECPRRAQAHQTPALVLRRWS
jgi:hypothetical protein